jgi:bacteriocin-like protein
MHEDHSELREVRPVATELSNTELETVVGGANAKTFQTNTYRFDPYKSFKFRG